MKVKPLGKRFLIRITKKDGVFEKLGEVLEISKEIQNTCVKVGDIVFCDKYSGIEFKTKQGVVVLIREDDILAIID